MLLYYLYTMKISMALMTVLLVERYLTYKHLCVFGEVIYRVLVSYFFLATVLSISSWL